MDIILGLIVIYTVSRFRIRKDPTTALGADSMLPIRGMCALMVVLHHIAQRTTGDWQVCFQYLTKLGFVPVSVFFAISGYALSTQYFAKKEQYLVGFVKKRYTALLIPFGVMLVVFTGLYALYAAMGLPEMSADIGFRYYDWLRNGITVVPFSWYVQMILALYLIFYGVYRYWGSRKILRYVGIVGGMVGILVLCKLLGYGRWWYNSYFAFLMGMLYFEYSKSKYYKGFPIWFTLPILISCFAVVYTLMQHTKGEANNIATQIASCIFPLIVFELLKGVQIKSKLFNYLGSRSYEIYLCQGVLTDMKEFHIVPIPSSTLFLALTVGSSILLGELLYRLNKGLMSKLRK